MVPCPEFVIYAYPDMGVPEMFAVMGLLPLFTAVNAAMFPVPVAGRPMPGVLLVQVYIQPNPGKTTGWVCCPLVTIWFDCALNSKDKKNKHRIKLKRRKNLYM
jgi:hypothetical protein